VDIEAEEYTLEGLTNAIIKYVIKESRTAEAQRSQRDVFNH
jgi:hypothetical protein